MKNEAKPLFSPSAPFLAEPFTEAQVSAYKPSPSVPPTLVYTDGSLYFGEVDPINRVPHGVGIMLYKHQELSEGFSLQAVRPSKLASYFVQGDRYGGMWEDGEFSGEGVLISVNCTICGSWSSGRPHGKGTAQYGKHFFDSEDVIKGLAGASWRGLSHLSPFEDKARKPQHYTGQFHKDHHRHGEGTVKYYNGDVYEGSWVQNSRNGYGKFSSMEGEQYEGHWLNDERHGRAVIRYADGSVFKGIVEHGQRHGPGTLRLPNGDEYNGTFTKNIIEGEGTMKYRNGDVYEGHWTEGRRHGEGRYTLRKTGATMRGTFVRGLIHGKGTVELPGVSLFAGTFIRGLRSEGSVYWQEGCEGDYRNFLCYQGGWKGEQMEGKGLLWLRDGGFYFGCFQQNKMEGQGNLRYGNGDEYSGHFHLSLPHGPGIFQEHTTGSIKAGIWFNGKLIEGYAGEWNGENIEGVGNISIGVQRIFSPSSKNYFGSECHLSDEWTRNTCNIEFKGFFKNGAREGPGVLKIPAMDSWPRGVRVQQGKKEGDADNRARQHVIKGSWKNNTLHCSRGVWVFPSGESYVGGFLDNHREDSCGRMWLPDGSLFIGAWRADAPSGRGTLFSKNTREPIFMMSAKEGPDESLGHNQKGSEASDRSAVYGGGVDFIMGFFRSSSPKPALKTRETSRGNIIGYEPHYVLTANWQDVKWDVKQCEVHMLTEALNTSTKGSPHPDLTSLQRSCTSGRTVWADGPSLTNRAEYFSTSDEEYLGSIKPPTHIRVGKVDDETLIIFPSGIILLNVFIDNRPQLISPHRPHSLLDKYKQISHYFCEERFPSRTFPSNSSPFSAELMETEPSFTLGDWKPFQLSAMLLPNGCQEVRKTHSNPTHCSFCGGEFSFFRRSSECFLCFRSACTSCLQNLSIKTSPSVASFAASAAVLHQTLEGPAFVFSNEVPTIPTCADCRKAVSDNLSVGIMWLPLQIFNSLVYSLKTSRSKPSHPEDTNSAAHDDFVIYSGYHSLGIPHVFGEMWWGENYYAGPYEKGVRTGFGYQVLPNKEVYMGFFQDDTWSGLGTYFFADRCVFRGFFKDGSVSKPMYHGEVNQNFIPDGLGISYEGNGTNYNGEWKNGIKNGRGVLQHMDGVVFSGSFVENNINGEGKLITPSSVFYGFFVNGKKEGKGMEFFCDCVVEGTWRDDVAEGLCRIYEKSTRDVYETTYHQGNERDDCFTIPSADSATAAECHKCRKAFYFMLRRHSCRLCLKFFCDSCSRERAALPLHFPCPPNSLQRVCDNCFQRLRQRRTLAVRQYGAGDVYAGCWSQGRWVSSGLYIAPNGLFVVMDELGCPCHPALSKAPPAVKPSTCQDATPSRSLLQNLTESSSLQALNQFVQWWDKSCEQCQLETPLNIPLVINFKKNFEKFTQSTLASPIALGTHDAALLSEQSVPALAYPDVPLFDTPPQFSFSWESRSASLTGTAPRHRFFRVIEQLVTAAHSPPSPPSVKLEGGHHLGPWSSQSFKELFDLNRLPNFDQHDLSESAIEEELLKLKGRGAPRPRLLPDTPPLPPFASDSQVRWDQWSVKDIPTLFPNSPFTGSFQVDEEMYFSCPFWKTEIVDVQRMIEEGKVAKGQELMNDGQRVMSSRGWLPSTLPHPLQPISPP